MQEETDDPQSAPADDSADHSHARTEAVTEADAADAPSTADAEATVETAAHDAAETTDEAVESHPETQEEIDQLLLKRLQSLQRPTWELELLISGAVVFSLFQIPGRLRGWFESISVHAGPDVGLLPFMAFYALTLVTICLAAAFSLHFVLRSVWVGITGLQSAFPKGIEWDQIDAGPVARRVLEEMNPSLEASEDRLDAVASSIFAVLFTVVVSFVAVFGLMLLPAFTGEILRSRFFPDVPSIAVFYGVVLLVAAPGVPVGLIDNWFKKDISRIDRHPRLYRFAYRTTKIVQFLFLGRLTSPVTLTLSSRFSLKKVTGGLVASIFLAVGIFLVYFVISMGLIGFDSYTFVPAERGTGFVDARYYGDADIDPRRAAPRIQSEVIEGPFIRLFVPVSPDRDDERVATHCPHIEPLRAEGLFISRRRNLDDDASVAEYLACWQRILVVGIDDRLLTPDWAFHEDPTTGRKGLLAFVPVDGLDGGRHELLVARRPSETARSVQIRPENGLFRVARDEDERSEGRADEGAGRPRAESTSAAPQAEPPAVASSSDGPGLDEETVEVADRDRHQIAFWLPPRQPTASRPLVPESAPGAGSESPSRN